MHVCICLYVQLVFVCMYLYVFVCMYLSVCMFGICVVYVKVLVFLLCYVNLCVPESAFTHLCALGVMLYVHTFTVENARARERLY